MAISDDQIQYIKEQLAGFGEVRSKRMFGGVGFFHQDIMFAMISGDGAFRMRADELNRKDYEEQGMEIFSMSKGTLPYWEVPETVASDPEELAVWARKAFDAALRNKKK